MIPIQQPNNQELSSKVQTSTHNTLICHIFCFKLSESSFIQLIPKLLFLFAYVLEFAPGGLHLLQGELVLALVRLVLGPPRVQLVHCVVQQLPLLHQSLHLWHPGIRDGLHLGVAGKQLGRLFIRLLMCRHLQGGCLSCLQHCLMTKAALIKEGDFVKQSQRFWKACWLSKAILGLVLCCCQPRGELLDTSPVLGPELDILTEVTGVLLHLFLEVQSELVNPLELLFVSESVSGHTFALG